MLNTTSILEEEVDVVEGNTDLGVHFDNRLDWKCRDCLQKGTVQSPLLEEALMFAKRYCRSSTGLLSAVC